MPENHASAAEPMPEGGDSCPSSLPPGPGFVDKNEAGVAHKPTHPLRRRLPALLQRGLLANLEEGRGGSLFLSFFLG